MALPALGSRGGGFPGGYQPPVVDSLDSMFNVAQVAEMKDEIPIRILRRKGVSVDHLPERAFVLGLVDVYRESPCKSGEKPCTEVYFVSAVMDPASGSHVRSMELYEFNRTYKPLQEFPEPTKKSLMELLS